VVTKVVTRVWKSRNLLPFQRFRVDAQYALAQGVAGSNPVAPTKDSSSGLRGSTYTALSGVTLCAGSITDR